ncbi:MAG: O-antigen ligase family protein [Kiritimatiellia bacterium]|nr:O-antigen ligase family protein [Kiritimatiellia bacterium]
MPEQGTPKMPVPLNRSDSSAPSGASTSSWPSVLDPEVLFPWVTLLVLPLFVMWPGFKSEVFVIYAVLFGLQVWRRGYVRSGLEPWLLVGLLGLAASGLDVRDAEVPRRVLQLARVVCLPLLMCQFRAIPRLERILAAGFCLLGLYGLGRLAIAPLVTGYAMDRPYCFSDFFMNSSLIAVSAFLFFLVVFIRANHRAQKVFYGANILLFAALVVLHQVRGSYLTLIVLTPVILLVEGRKKARVSLVALVLGAILLTGLVHTLRPDLTTAARVRLTSIVDRQDGSNRGRLVIWSRALEVFRDHPVNGIGYRRFNREHVDLNNREFEWAFWHAHSEYLSMLAETGSVGTLAWLAFKVGLLAVLFRYRRQPLGAFLLYLALAFEMHNLVETYHYERTAYIYIYLLLGLGLNQLVPKPANRAGEGA